MGRWLLSFPLGQRSKVMACHLLGLTPLLLFMSPPTEKEKKKLCDKKIYNLSEHNKNVH